jgi:zinc transporter ZupT
MKDSPDNTDGLMTVKWIAIVSLFVMAMVGGILPLKMREMKGAALFLSLGNMFSGGVFLGGGLMHLLPESAENLEQVQQQYFSEDSPWFSFPFAFFLCGLGFFAILLVEEMALASTHGAGPVTEKEVQEAVRKEQRGREKRRKDRLSGKRIADSPTPFPPTPQLRHREFIKLYNERKELAQTVVTGIVPRVFLASLDDDGADSDLEAVCKHEHGTDGKGTDGYPFFGKKDDSAGHKSSSRAIKTKTKVTLDDMAAPLLLQEDDYAMMRDFVSDGSDTDRKSTGTGDHPSDSGGEEGLMDAHAHVDSADAHTHVHDEQHGHSHFGAVTDGSSTVVAYLLVIALSFHSVFEGVALGTTDDTGSAVGIFIAIAAHTPLAGFALGVSLVKAKAKTRLIVSLITLFSVTVPFGAIAGIALSYYLEGDTLLAVSGGFQSFSSGTFLFVALEEVIPKELANPAYKRTKLALCVFGFMLMAMIKVFDTD